MAARGLTRKISRRQARSYQITTPNPGVTSIASVNGKALRSARLGQMKKKHAAELRRIAAGKREAPTYSRVTRNAAKAELRRRGLSEYDARYERTRALLKGEKNMAVSRRRASRNYTAREMESLFEGQMAGARSGSGTKKKKRITKAKRASLARKRAATAKRRTGASYGRFRSLVGRVGKRRVPTYAYAGPRGKPKKIPLWAILGQKSKKSFERRVSESPRLARRVVGVKRKRERAASRILQHGDFFTPNRTRTRRRKAVPFKTWSANMFKKARRNYKKGTKLRGKAKAALVRRLQAGRRKAARLRTGGTKRRKSSGRKAGTRKRRTAAQRRATARMLSARWGRRVKARRTWKNKAPAASAALPNRRRRRARRNPGVITQAAANRRRRRKARRNVTITQAAANRRRRRKARRNPGITQAAANKRRRRKKARRNVTITQAAANRRHRRRKTRRNQDLYMSNRRRHHGRRRARRNQNLYMSNRRRRHYRRNPALMGQLKEVLKIGAYVALGYLGHRALTFVVGEKLLGSVSMFQAGALAEYRGLIAGAVTAVGGVALLAQVAPTKVGQVGAGMMASLLQSVIVFGLKKLGQPEVAGYLSAYPDAEGHAFHSMRGYGSYYMEPTAGLGEYDYYNQYSGMGQITQAAAGVGEFYMPGVAGLGEYEAVHGLGSGMGVIQDGIHPNLDAAEHELSIAEAAAGIGDLPLTSTVDAFQVAAPIMDGPTGSRAGILQGNEGIFGGA